MIATKADIEKDEGVLTEFIETTTYVGEVENWEDHLTETEESEDEPEEE